MKKTLYLKPYNTLDQVMQIANISISKLAEFSGVARQTVAQIKENRGANPTQMTQAKIANALDKNPNEIFKFAYDYNQVKNNGFTKVHLQILENLFYEAGFKVYLRAYSRLRNVMITTKNGSRKKIDFEGNLRFYFFNEPGLQIIDFDLSINRPVPMKEVRNQYINLFAVLRKYANLVGITVITHQISPFSLDEIMSDDSYVYHDNQLKWVSKINHIKFDVATKLFGYVETENRAGYRTISCRIKR